jgi:large subunit ribosomal protein L3
MRENLMANSQLGLIGRKLGMTQLFNADGTVTPVTVVEVGPNRVLQVKSTTGKDGYNAIQLGWGPQKASRISQPEAGHLAKTSSDAVRWIAEIRVSAEALAGITPGQTLGAADVFTEGALADVTGTSKGRGFGGVMKSHHFKGFIRTHGSHEYFRHGGSIGTRLTPGMTLKGKKMPGHLGAEQVTTQNIRIARVDAARNLVFLAGAVPGPKGGFIKLRKAVKAK